LIEDGPKIGRRQDVVRVDAQELWESRQMGKKIVEEIESEEEAVEIELNEEEAPFLRGKGSLELRAAGMDKFKEIKITNDPDGVLSKTAQKQEQIMKDRKIIKQVLQKTEENVVK